jgi:hypothetical protein
MGRQARFASAVALACALYAFPAVAAVVEGTVESLSGDELVLKTDDGVQQRIDASRFSKEERQRLQKGRRVAVEGRLVGQTVRVKDGDTAASGSWTRHFGTIEKIDGRQVTLKEDNGQTLRVNVGNVDEESRKALKDGAVVTVIGTPGNRPEDFRAGFVREGRGWDRLHGTVEKVSGANASVKSDEGPTVSVDLSRVSEDRRKDLRRGDAVTVIGYGRGDPRKLDAFDAYQIVTGDAASALPGQRR